MIDTGLRRPPRGRGQPDRVLRHDERRSRHDQSHGRAVHAVGRAASTTAPRWSPFLAERRARGLRTRVRLARRARTRRAATRSTRTSATARTSAARSSAPVMRAAARASTTRTIGMAPDAKFRAYSANVGPSLLNTQTLAAYDDMTYKKEQGYSKVVAVNNSWGGGGGSNYNPADPTVDRGQARVRRGHRQRLRGGQLRPRAQHALAPSASSRGSSASRRRRSRTRSWRSRRRAGRASRPTRTATARSTSADVPPDNHDRLLGQTLELGLYRPTLTAPGVNINSMKAIGREHRRPDCRDLPRGRLHPDLRGSERELLRPGQWARRWRRRT